MAGYCEQCQARSFPQKAETILSSKMIISLTRRTPLHAITVQAC